MTTRSSKDFGIIILLDSLGTRQKILDDIDKFLTNWNLVLNRLEENVRLLEQELSGKDYRIGIKTKDIFDNIQIFYPTDDPHTKYIDLSGNNSLWWSIQSSADLLTNIVRYGITRNIYFRGCISMGHIQEYRNGYYSTSMIENADFADSFEMIGVIAGLSVMRILNNRSYFSSPRLYNFVKYRIPIKDPTRQRRNLFDRLVPLNITKKSDILGNIDDKEINMIIQEQIQTHRNNSVVRKRWENTRAFIEYVQHTRDQNCFL